MDKSNIKVSIIIPIYNVEKYLKKCLTSVISQTLKEIEIICINDGSTDKSLKILKEFAKKDPRIILIDKKNNGVAIARNIGINNARGEFLGFIDSDDWIDVDYFEKLYDAAKSYNCEIACAGFKRFKYGKGTIRKKYTKQELIYDINRKIEADNLPQDNYIWNKIYKR